MGKANEVKEFHAKDRAEWRAWLERNHDNASGVWLIIHKKGSERPCITYEEAIEEAIEEALCFGWIDSRPNVLDEERFKLLLTPRKPNSLWSRSNKQRARRLIEKSLMTPAGLSKIEEAKRNGYWDILEEIEDLVVPADLEKALAAHPPADDNFKAFGDSYKKQALWWIRSAKLPETRAKRVGEIARLAAENKKANQYVRKK